MLLTEPSKNWVFLGDSLTEGIGSSRISYVSELTARLRVAAGQNASKHYSIHEIRLRKVDPDGFNRFVRFNIAGYFDVDEQVNPRTVWIWNLACEGQTLETDSEWLPFLRNLRPDLVIVFRGSLESIVRPAMLKDGMWPWWIPQSWRSYAAMDPRCYFSTTWWRKVKQLVLDVLKQQTRYRLLQYRPGVPLMDTDTFISHYRTLLFSLREMQARIIMLGLLPVDEVQFPGSPKRFREINLHLDEIANTVGCEFFDWASQLTPYGDCKELFYRDGFHPNLAGARVLASILEEYLL